MLVVALKNKKRRWQVLTPNFGGVALQISKAPPFELWEYASDDEGVRE